MNDTPRTDAHTKECAIEDDLFYFVEVEFAQELERENNKLRNELQTAMALISQLSCMKDSA